MANYTTNFTELLYPGLMGIWGLSYPGYTGEWKKLGFEVKKSKKKYEKTLGLTGFGLAATKTEGNSVTYDDAYQGYTQTLTNVVKGLGFIVSKEMYTDDQYDKINALPKALKWSMLETQEWDMANVFNRAFNSSYTGADGKELCATDHPLVAGGTEQNELSTSADLSMTSLEQAMIDIADMTNDRGLLAGLKVKKLIVPPELAWTAQQLMGSDKDPESNYNAINPAKSLFPEGFVVNHYLTDPDAWFILTTAQSGLVFYDRWPLEFTKDNEFDSDNAKFKATMRYIMGWDDFRQVFGSPGA